jgi:hypothetical protein
MTVTQESATWAPLSPQDREAFERDGFIIVRNVLTPDEVAIAREALMKAYERAQQPGGHGLTKTGSLHQLSAITTCPELAFLLDHPKAFGHVWSLMGWNIHVYHSHVDVHPHIDDVPPFRWEWHQDGGRQNREIETDPRPRLSVKLGYWFSDVSETGRGNLMVIPGSHTVNWLNGPPRRDLDWPTPEGAIEVTANPGDAVFFDRRIWHARSDNFSDITRMVSFIGYTYRWIAIRDEVDHLPNEPWWNDLTPVQKQLLGGVGDGTGDDKWGHYPQNIPLYGELAARGLLDKSNPPLIP